MLMVATLSACTTDSSGSEGIPKQYPPAPAFASASSVQAPLEPSEDANGATLVADVASSGGPLDAGRFLNASQGGYGAMRNLHWLADQSAQISSMGLREIRIDHVFDEFTYNIIRRSESGEISYNFELLDSVLEPFLANGVRPFFALSYMPPSLGPDRHGPPTSMDAWSDAVGALVSHYSGLGHSGLGYEVWNEIDAHSWNGTIEQYNALYAASAAAVKSADPSALVGGAAASGIDSAGNWSGQFIDYVGANPQVPIDFFSVHSYRTDRWDEVPIARGMLDAAGLTGLPIYITEWNDISIMTQGPGEGSDSNYGASGPASVAKRLYRTFASEGDKFFYFTPLEGMTFNMPYNGDLGLITVDGHRKASGNVFEMFSHLESTLVPSTVKGAGTEDENVFGFVTKDAEGSAVRAVLWNNTSQDTTMTVNLKGLPFGESNFRVTQTNVNATQGNGFADASTTVAPDYPSANENAPVVIDDSHEPAQKFVAEVFLPAKSTVSVDLAPTKRAPGTLARSAEPSKQNLAASAAGASVSASSSIEDEGLGWAEWRLTDGRRHSIEVWKAPIRGWSSAAHAEPTATESVQVDFGESKPIDTVVLWPRDSQSHDGAGFPEDFTIQGSLDGETWDVLNSETGYVTAHAPTGAQSFEFDAAEYRYVKVEATVLTDGDRTGTPAYSFQLQEIEAYRNGIANGGFESGTLDGWKTKGTVTVQSASTHSGAYGAQLTGDKAKVSMLIKGLLPNTSYTIGTHARPETAADRATLSASEFGGKKASTSLSTPQWGSAWVTFTTGPDHTSAVIELSKKGSGSVWADDFIVTQGATASSETAAPEPSKAP